MDDAIHILYEQAQVKLPSKFRSVSDQPSLLFLAVTWQHVMSDTHLEQAAACAQMAPANVFLCHGHNGDTKRLTGRGLHMTEMR